MSEMAADYYAMGYEAGRNDMMKVLESIKKDIVSARVKADNDYDHGRFYGLYIAEQIINKQHLKDNEQHNTDKVDCFNGCESCLNSGYCDYEGEKTTNQDNPPLGIMPQSIWNIKRAGDLFEAMKRYTNYQKPIPIEWITELEDLFTREAIVQDRGIESNENNQKANHG